MSAGSSGNKKDPLGIYVHVPFCLKKCRYCDFVSRTAAESSLSPEEYIAGVCGDIKSSGLVYGNRYYADTVYFGGGTPTCLAPELLIKVLDSVRASFVLASDAEISFEANPETVVAESVRALRDAGFNRASMGAQSFDDGILSSLGRVHSSAVIPQAYEKLRSAGFSNINLDLMFGLPGQTPEIWRDTLLKAADLFPEHISFYSLQLEEDTPLYEEYRFGGLTLPAWEENREMYHFARSFLAGRGYRHYEISNAARPGFECRHNLKYWHMMPYLGFGESAHSFIEGKRTDCAEPDLKGDYIFTELRLIDGFELSDYRRLFGTDFTQDYAEPLKDLTNSGLLEVSGGRVRLTERGLDNTNPVMEELLNG